MLSLSKSLTLVKKQMTLSKEDTWAKVDQKLFRGMIGSLLYLTASRGFPTDYLLHENPKEKPESSFHCPFSYIVQTKSLFDGSSSSIPCEVEQQQEFLWSCDVSCRASFEQQCVSFYQQLQQQFI